MQLDDQTVATFREVFERETGKALSQDRAREIVQRALTLYDLLLRPLPVQAFSALIRNEIGTAIEDADKWPSDATLSPRH